MKIVIKPNTYLYLAILLLLIPLPWLISWLIAVFFHEFCHWLGVKLGGGSVLQLTVGLSGANMESTAMSERQRLLAVLSGPAGGLLLLLLARWFPKIAICSWLLSMYNLLPVLPLDGGRALQILLRRDRVFCTVERVLLFCLTLLAVYSAFFLKFGILPIMIISILWLKNRKSPCKEMICKVQ